MTNEDAGWGGDADTAPAPGLISEEPTVRARRRASTLRGVFIAFLIGGLVGSIGLGVAGSKRSSIDGFGNVTTTTDSGVEIALTFGGIAATLTTTLPLLGLSFVLEGQADILEAAAPAEDDADE